MIDTNLGNSRGNANNLKHEVLGRYRQAVDKAMQSARRYAADLVEAHTAQEAALAYVEGFAGVDLPDPPETGSWPATVDALIAEAKGRGVAP